MKQAGKTSVITIFGILGAVTIGILMFFGQESPSTACTRFLDALARGDVDAVVKNSFMAGVDDAKAKESWTYTLKTAAPYYRFGWEILNTKTASDTKASVEINFVRNIGSDMAYPERFGIPMEKKDGTWKVDVRSLPRKIFPSFPR